MAAPQFSPNRLKEATMQNKVATDAVIGVVVSGDTLVYVVRRNDELSEPVRESACDVQRAAALLRDRCELADVRHAQPVIYVEANEWADAVVEAICKDQPAPAVSVVNGLDRGTGSYYDRRSQLYGDFQKRVALRTLVIPPSIRAEFDAFAADVGERDGKVRFPTNEVIELKRGRRPVSMMAAVLAAIQTLGGGVGKAASDWDPTDGRE